MWHTLSTGVALARAWHRGVLCQPGLSAGTEGAQPWEMEQGKGRRKGTRAGGGCWVPGSALPACQLGALPPHLNVSDDVSCPRQLFPLGPGQQGLFCTHSQQLGWLGPGLLPELCQAGSVATLPCQLLAVPTASPALPGSGLLLTSLGCPFPLVRGEKIPQIPPLGRAEQGPFCAALGTSPPLCPVPQLLPQGQGQ